MVTSYARIRVRIEAALAHLRKGNEAVSDQTEERMDGMFDQAKGKAKETWGKHTDNEDVEAEGKIDQASGRVKEGMADVKDAAEDVVKELSD